MVTSRIEVEGSSSSAILRTSVGSTKIGSPWGATDEGLVDAELNAWDNSSTPRTDWDAMVDNCEKGDQKLNISLRRIWSVYLSS